MRGAFHLLPKSPVFYGILANRAYSSEGCIVNIMLYQHGARLEGMAKAGVGLAPHVDWRSVRYQHFHSDPTSTFGVLMIASLSFHVGLSPHQQTFCLMQPRECDG